MKEKIKFIFENRNKLEESCIEHPLLDNVSYNDGIVIIEIYFKDFVFKIVFSKNKIIEYEVVNSNMVDKYVNIEEVLDEIIRRIKKI